MSDARHWLTLTTGLCAVLVTASACPLISDPNHCANMDQNPCLASDVCDPCTPSSQSNGCVADGLALDEDPDAPGCQLDGSATTDTTVGEDTTATSTVEPTMTTVEPDTTVTAEDTMTTTGEPQPCMTNEDCMEPSAPFCSPVTMACVSCMGMPDPKAACESVDPALPACDAGVCVQCTSEVTDACEGTTPICDDEANACVACTEHAQCGEAACNLFTGACLPAEEVLHVGPGQPFTSLNTAVATVGMGAEATIIVHDGSFDEPVTVSGERVIAFLADDGAQPIWQRTGGVGNPQLSVSGASTVLMDGIQLRNNSAITLPALRIDGSLAWLDRAQILQNDGVAVLAENSAEIVVRSSMLGSPTDRNVLSVQGSTADVIYSTLASNYGMSAAVFCDAASVVTVRDSILVSRDAGVADCRTLTTDHTASSEALPGTNNMEVGLGMTEWFVDYAADLHLTPAGQGIFVDLAEWNDAPREPLFDIDGDPRSGIDGTLEHAGADLPP